MRWDDIDRFYYSVTREFINFIPASVYHELKLVDTRVRRIRFGNSVERPGEG
jgi:hypothetical protein